MLQTVTMPIDSEDMEKFKNRLLRTKTIISQSSVDDEGGGAGSDDVRGQGDLEKVLSTFDLISLGVGSCVGTGMYVVAGLVAKNVAGPAVILSFIIAAVASILSGEKLSCVNSCQVTVINLSSDSRDSTHTTIIDQRKIVKSINCCICPHTSTNNRHGLMNTDKHQYTHRQTPIHTDRHTPLHTQTDTNTHRHTQIHTHKHE